MHTPRISNSSIIIINEIVSIIVPLLPQHGRHDDRRPIIVRVVGRRLLHCPTRAVARGARHGEGRDGVTCRRLVGKGLVSGCGVWVGVGGCAVSGWVMLGLMMFVVLMISGLVFKLLLVLLL